MGEKERKAQRIVFHTTHTAEAALVLANMWVKKFQELKWSMPQSHDIHLTSLHRLLPLLLRLGFPALP